MAVEAPAAALAADSPEGEGAVHCGIWDDITISTTVTRAEGTLREDVGRDERGEQSSRYPLNPQASLLQDAA